MNKKRLSVACTSLFAIALLVACEGCENDTIVTPKKDDKKVEIKVPEFSSDSAYQFIQQQVDFGPRVPNTDSHLQCAAWLEQKLRSYGADVIVQQANVKAYNGTMLNIKNVIGQYNPTAKKRVMLYAHWDTRPFADKDDDKANCEKPIAGANDGGSGVGVLLEIARLLNTQPLSYGIDIVFFDAEDYGRSECEEDSDNPEDYTFWCLGSQYWTKQPHKAGYRAKYGILLDMVGAKGAIFNKEGTSMVFAPHIVDKLWSTGQSLGYDEYFRNDQTLTTVDDNLFVSRDGGVPSANIVEFHLDESGNGSGNYGDYHHTMEDNMSVIDKSTLKAVGQTLAHVIYSEQ